MKDLSGGDGLAARFMRQDDFEFDRQLTRLIAGNNGQNGLLSMFPN